MQESHFSSWPCWIPDQPAHGYANELFVSPNILPDGTYPTVTRGSTSAYQLNQLPSSLAPNHKIPNTKQKSLPKLIPATTNRAASRPMIVSCHDDEWLAGLLKRLRTKSLQSLLGKAEASWTLASIMLPPTSSEKTLDLPSLETAAASIASIVHIEGSIVYVDLVESDQVCFQLTSDTIEALRDYHDTVHCPAVTANMVNDSATEEYRLAMKDRFRKAIEEFLFYTGKGCLEGTEHDGSGELCWTRPAKVKSAILALFQHPPSTLNSSIRDSMAQSAPTRSIWSDVDTDSESLALENGWQPNWAMDINFTLRRPEVCPMGAWAIV